MFQKNPLEKSAMIKLKIWRITWFMFCAAKSFKFALPDSCSPYLVLSPYILSRNCWKYITLYSRISSFCLNNKHFFPMKLIILLKINKASLLTNYSSKRINKFSGIFNAAFHAIQSTSSNAGIIFIPVWNR